MILYHVVNIAFHIMKERQLNFFEDPSQSRTANPETVPAARRSKERKPKPPQAPTLYELYQYEFEQFYGDLAEALEARGLIREEGLTEEDLAGHPFPDIDVYRENLLEQGMWFREQIYEEGRFNLNWTEYNRPAEFPEKGIDGPPQSK